MKTYFDGAGFSAEQIAVQQFKGKLVTDKAQQYKDIDAVLPTKKGVWNTVSIKDQLWSSKKFGGIQIETELVNTRNGKTMPGCFYQNESVMYFWRVWTKEHGDTWFIVKSSVLKEYVEKNKSSLKTWQTQQKTEAKNRSYNRAYDRAKGCTLWVKDITHLGQLKPVQGGKKP